ncbi:MAG TPA: SpoIIE family protein phosphatase [Edaphobacter sp.]|jgi:sigma-B regulation protein RsbU (phosphoserine phosphatase)|nr:SpoIIE family protein phosphatase [Edaphobacter sp.]
MLQRSARIQYALLALVAFFALTHSYMGVVDGFSNLAHGNLQARIPFFLGSLGHAVRLTTPEAVEAGRRPGDTAVTVTLAMPEAEQAGLHAGDAVLDINRRPFTGGMVLLEELRNSRPGRPMSLTILRADRSEATIAFPLAADRPTVPSIWAWVMSTVFLLLPIFCMFVGLYTVLARPRSLHSWLILGVLAYLPAVFISQNRFFGPLTPAALVWNIVAQTAMPICLMLFGIYFPERSKLDIRAPWVKWLILIPLLLLVPTDFLTSFGHTYNFNLDTSLDPWVLKINMVENVISILAVFYFFATIGTKMGSSTGDARRRLKILYYGAAVGLTPFFFLVVFALIRSKDVGQDVPRWVILSALFILLLFPLSLAYVVIVHRAVDIRILIRQGTRYALARQSINIVRVLLAIWLSLSMIDFARHPGHQRSVDVVRIFGIITLSFIFRFRLSKRLQQKIDQRFFREAYSTEQILSELSDEARNFTEVVPLIHTITQRLGETLHIERIAVFLRSGDSYRLQLATGAPLMPSGVGVISLPSASTTIATLTRDKSPASVYRDDPSSWLIDATEAERSALADLSTELLVPLPGRNRLAGVIALGPKRSEEPYTKTDRQLLQTIASQTGLALENAELLENLTAEISQRERFSREIEIAREVQQRLFPQTYPKVPAVDLAGFCRPAQAVGGDYYDYFLLGDGRLALCLGDISGKGISAALLMASLRASLRSIAGLQQRDIADLIRHVNNLVYESSATNRYATFFYAELDPANRLLTYVNAGHNAPYILRNKQAIALEATGMVVGLLPDAEYAQETIPMQPGDFLVAFTDGISEAMTGNEEEWGEDRMVATAQELLERTGDSCSAQQLLDCILSAADKFTSGAPQHDDMTLLIMSSQNVPGLPKQKSNDIF